MSGWQWLLVALGFFVASSPGWATAAMFLAAAVAICVAQVLEARR
jgi:hypothetical protein